MVKVLDPARVPDPSRLRRSDIKDLVVRRFREADLARVVRERQRATLRSWSRNALRSN
jgi:hypothetical protein